MNIMIIATILNAKTGAFIERPFHSVESATNTIIGLNEHHPEIGLLMLIDWRDADPEEINNWKREYGAV
jgi:hypothetical protein